MVFDTAVIKCLITVMILLSRVIIKVQRLVCKVISLCMRVAFLASFTALSISRPHEILEPFEDTFCIDQTKSLPGSH